MKFMNIKFSSNDPKNILNAVIDKRNSYCDDSTDKGIGRKCAYDKLTSKIIKIAVSNGLVLNDETKRATYDFIANKKGC